MLQSGEELEADVVISATGLKMIPFGGIKMFVDEEQINFAQTTQYKGVMLSGIPNFFVASGYTNASWTLKCDLTSQYFCRLVNYCLKKGHKVCVPKDIENSEEGDASWLGVRLYFEINRGVSSRGTKFSMETATKLLFGSF